MHLTDTEKITVLMMRGYGDRIRSYQKVVDLFNATYPDRVPISKPTVERIVGHFQKIALDVLLTAYDNLHISISRAAQENDISILVHRILKKHHYHPYKIHLLSDDRKVEFCDTMMIRLADNRQFFNWICFSNEATDACTQKRACPREALSFFCCCRGPSQNLNRNVQIIITL
ncbi:hypothetical protein ACFW04_013664 [Cataglyphis niger]